MLEMFRSDAFSVLSLTEAINNLKFVPSRIGKMGLFTPRGLTTTTAAIELKNGGLIIVPPTPRGAPGTTVEKGRRSLLDVRIPHFEINDAIMAEEVQGVRAFGEETAVETVTDKVNERNAEHSQSMEATSEYSRIGAIKGLITYADSTTLDLFDIFDVLQIAEVDFDLDNATPGSGALRKKIAGVVRLMANELGGLPWKGIGHAFCGDAFYDDLIAHPEVRATYAGWAAAAELRKGYITGSEDSFGAFEFGDILWENYRGKVGATDYIHTDKCHIFPLGSPGLFRTYWAPADYIDTVNTKGKRLYSKMWEMPNQKGMNLDVQMNELNLCTRPRVLIQGKRT